MITTGLTLLHFSTKPYDQQTGTTVLNRHQVRITFNQPVRHAPPKRFIDVCACGHGLHQAGKLEGFSCLSEEFN